MADLAKTVTILFKAVDDVSGIADRIAQKLEFKPGTSGIELTFREIGEQATAADGMNWPVIAWPLMLAAHTPWGL